MRNFATRLAACIRSIANHPLTAIVKGFTLLLIGLSDVSHTLWTDLGRGTIRVGHGLILIGLFGIFDALPNFIESLEAGGRYLDLREKRRAVSTKDGRKE